MTEQDPANAKGVRFKQGETEYHLLAVQNSLTESELCVVLANGDTLLWQYTRRVEHTLGGLSE